LYETFDLYFEFFLKNLYNHNFFKRKNIDPHQCMDEIANFFFLKARGSPTNFYQPSWGKNIERE
jgi:hypothetical protein